MTSFLAATAAKKAQRYLARRELQLKKEIAELLEDLDQLTQQACPGLRKTYGIAVDGALMLPTASKSMRLGPLYVV